MLDELFETEAPVCVAPRPPGALPEKEFLAACSRCDACIEACPHGSIGRMPPGTGVFAGTPAMNTQRVACHLCEDQPCVTACEDGALSPVPWEAVFFGLAVVNTSTCFVFKGPECGACRPACPLKAIRLEACRPIVDDEICNGCGLCREACPVWDKAIDIVG